MLKVRHSVAFAGLLVAVALASAACDSNSFSGGFKDLENVKPVNPDKAVLLNNVDGFPNVVIICTNGVALATTTRGNSAAALRHIAALDKICPGYTAPAAPQTDSGDN